MVAGELSPVQHLRDRSDHRSTPEEHRTVDYEKDLTAALASFEPVWRELFPAERARILHLLIEEVRYDADAGEVAITFRPGGVRSLAREDGRETA